ncbi:MAG: hypothetical protein ABI208_09535 [Ginsengibacter sp.]
MNLQNLSLVFNRINNELPLPEYLQVICAAIAVEPITKQRVDEILERYQVKRGIATIDFLHLIFAYIKIALEDERLTELEKNNIKFLKTLFHIQRGDFCYYNNWDVEKTIMDQLSKMYEDDFITEEEAELKSALQEIFDLSFDQMNDYAKLKAAGSIQKGVEPKNLDIFFTYEEYFKIR